MPQSGERPEYTYQIHIWNGKDCGSLARALALTKGNELDTLLGKAQDSVLRALFGGGVIRGIKLQRGSVYTFENTNENQPTSNAMLAQSAELYEKNRFV